MVLNIKDITNISDRDLSRIALWLFAAVIAIAPGVLLLFLEKATDLISANTIFLLVICLAISIPFHLLGVVTFLHPRQTLKDLPKLKNQFSHWPVVFGIGIWSIICAAACFAFVHGFQAWLSSNINIDIRVQYCFVGFVMFSFFGLLFMFNSSKINRGS